MANRASSSSSSGLSEQTGKNFFTKKEELTVTVASANDGGKWERRKKISTIFYLQSVCL